MGIYDEPVDDAQTGNTASSQYCKETRETNQYMCLSEQTTTGYLDLYTDLQQSEENGSDDDY